MFLFLAFLSSSIEENREPEPEANGWFSASSDSAAIPLSMKTTSTRVTSHDFTYTTTDLSLAASYISGKTGFAYQDISNSLKSAKFISKNGKTSKLIFNADMKGINEANGERLYKLKGLKIVVTRDPSSPNQYIIKVSGGQSMKNVQGQCYINHYRRTWFFFKKSWRSYHSRPFTASELSNLCNSAKNDVRRYFK